MIDENDMPEVLWHDDLSTSVQEHKILGEGQAIDGLTDFERFFLEQKRAARRAKLSESHP